MYHIALFHPLSSIDGKETLKMEEKLRFFLDDDFSEVSLHIKNREIRIRSPEDLKISEDFIDSSLWFIHGKRICRKRSLRLPESDIYSEKTLLQINELFRWFADNYSWTIFPWGGMGTYSCLVFLSSEISLRDKFIECSDNSVKVAFYDDMLTSSHIIRETDMIISSYDVSSNIEDSFKAILFYEESDTAGHRVWDICDCSDVRPYVVYHSAEYFGLEECEPWITKGNYSVSDTFEPFEASENPYGFESIKFSIYKPRDKKTFMLMCHYFLFDFPTLVVFPGTTALNKIPELIKKTENKYAYSDLWYIKEYLNLDWFYALGREDMDCSYSLFVSKHSKLIKKFVSLPVSDDEELFRLVSCF